MGLAAEKQDEPSRRPHQYQEHPRPEYIGIAAGLASPDGTLIIVANGKYHAFTVSRRQIMGICEQAFGGLKKMEPGR